MFATQGNVKTNAMGLPMNGAQSVSYCEAVGKQRMALLKLKTELENALARLSKTKFEASIARIEPSNGIRTYILDIAESNDL